MRYLTVRIALGPARRSSYRRPFDVSLALSLLEPAETPGIGTPFVFLYAQHDALRGIGSRS